MATNQKAYLDDDFLSRDELRHIRVQLELFRPRLTFDDMNIESTVAVFGSARCKPKSKSYKAARKFSKLCSEWAATLPGDGKEFMVLTGGGPGIMEAGNRGADDVNAESIGLSISLPFECHSNKYITPELDILFQYFSTRKMHFLMRAKAVIAFPGGFGTMDEIFETLTLVQTKRNDRIPIILYDEEFWKDIINFEKFVEYGYISEEDLSLFKYANKPKEALQIIKDFYNEEV